MNLKKSVWMILVVSVAFLATAAQAKSFNQICPKNQGRMLVYGVGASTMGSVLGPMLDKRLKKRNLSFRMWGKASSGLARPDFHDWPSKFNGIIRRFSPELFIVSLGANDGQHLWHKKRWVRFGTKEWNKIYKERVKTTLDKLVGKEKKRAVIWVGPYNMDSKRTVNRSKIINRLIKETVNAFKGPVAYHDLFKLTTNRDGTPITTYIDVKGNKKRARARDGIHLGTRASLTLITLPLLKLINKCLPSAAAARARRAKTKRDKKGR